MNRLVILVLIAMVFFGCRKSERDEDVLTNTSEENAFAQAIFADAFKIINKAALSAEGISNSTVTDTTLFGCDVITVDTLDTPKLLIVDFRFGGCIATHGISRKGRIVSEVTGNYPDSNSIVNILFLNYVFGEYTVDGNLIVVNRGRNEAGNRRFTFFVQDGTISNDRGTIVWQANLSWEFFKGGTTTTLSDDEYRITGTTFGFNSEGNEFDAEVTIDNIISQECLQIVGGSSALNVKNLSKRTVNYGNGNCDRTAVVTINGKDRTVNLRQ